MKCLTRGFLDFWRQCNVEVLWYRSNSITVTAVRSELYANRTNERQPDHTMYGAGMLDRGARNTYFRAMQIQEALLGAAMMKDGMISRNSMSIRRDRR